MYYINNSHRHTQHAHMICIYICTQKNAESSIILMITESLLSIVLARLYCNQIVIEISSNQTILSNTQTPKYSNENQLENIVLKIIKYSSIINAIK